jgi:hypothetical protein
MINHLWIKKVCLNKGIYSYSGEHQEDKGSNYNADYLQAREPLLVAPANGLEHTPKTVCKMQEQCHKPDYVAN